MLHSTDYISDEIRVRSWSSLALCRPAKSPTSVRLRPPKMSEQITHSLVFIRAFISALGQSSGITFTPFGWTAAPQHPRARKKKSKGIQPWHLILFVVLERNFLLEKEKEGHEYERLPSCEGLKIEHVLSHLFVFYSQNNSFLIAFFLRAGVSFFTWRTRNAFFPSIHLKWRWWWCWTGHLELTPA